MAAAKKTKPADAAAPPTGLAEAAGMPPWKAALLEFVDRQTGVPLVQQLADGVITEDVLLYLNLGISSGKLGAMGVRINLIIKQFSSKKKKVYLTLPDLGGCDTLADLIKLVGSRM